MTKAVYVSGYHIRLPEGCIWGYDNGYDSGVGGWAGMFCLHCGARANWSLQTDIEDWTADHRTWCRLAPAHTE